MPKQKGSCSVTNIIMQGDNPWGDGADNAFSLAKHTLVLTGTPIRSDGSESVWIAYDNRGKLTIPRPVYTLPYGEAVDWDIAVQSLFTGMKEILQLPSKMEILQRFLDLA